MKVYQQDIKNGECYTSEGSIEPLPENIPTITVDGLSYYISNGTMSWDAAYYYCQAVAKKMNYVGGMARASSKGSYCSENNECPGWKRGEYYWHNKMVGGETTPQKGSCRAWYICEDGYIHHYDPKDLRSGQANLVRAICHKS